MKFSSRNVRFVFAAACFIASLAFMSCGGEVRMNLQASRLVNAVETRTAEYVTATFIIEDMDSDYTYEYIQEMVPSFKNPRYEDYNSSSSLYFEAEIPIIVSENFKESLTDGNLMYIIGSKNNGAYDFEIKYNGMLIQYLNKVYESKHGYSVSLSDVKVCIGLEGDRTGVTEYKLYSSYCGSRAFPFESNVLKLGYGSKVSFELSEIVRKSMDYDSGAYRFLTILN